MSGIGPRPLHFQLVPGDADAGWWADDHTLRTTGLYILYMSKAVHYNVPMYTTQNIQEEGWF